MASLVLIVLHYLQLSWRKWPDLQIDFGRELYVPWRLAAGDVLGRDIESPFGPLSPHLNAALFALGGPSFMLLVAANLVVYAANVITLYRLLRAGWGALAAWAASVVFISVFSFSQYLWTGNYNFAAPYAHEATHGFLVCLLLTAALDRYARSPRPALAALAGLLFGLTFLLKIEFIAAGAIVVAATFVLCRRDSRPRSLRRDVVPFALGSALPTFLSFALLAQHLPWRQAFLVTGKAGLTLFLHNRLGTELDQQTYLGTDQFWANLLEGAVAALITLAAIGLLLLGARGLERLRATTRHRGWPWLFAAALVGGTGLAGSFVPWLSAGRGLFWVTLITGVLAVRSLLRLRDAAPELRTRLLVIALALALLLRMALNARLTHYGFYQAALAAMTFVATVVTDWPQRALATHFARQTVRLAVGAVLAIGVFQLTEVSVSFLERKTLLVGTGSDAFHHYDQDRTPEPDIPPDDSLLDLPLPSGESTRAAAQQADELAGQIFSFQLSREHDRSVWYNQVAGFLARTAPETTALVLPEGVVLNYLARRRTPLAITKYFGVELAGGREAAVVSALEKKPPAYAVLVSRDLRGLGIPRYGATAGQGQLILEWLNQHYAIVSRAGGDPLDPTQQGIVLWRRKSASTP